MDQSVRQLLYPIYAQNPHSNWLAVVVELSADNNPVLFPSHLQAS
jgi:hypothetical protein